MNNTTIHNRDPNDSNANVTDKIIVDACDYLRERYLNETSEAEKNNLLNCIEYLEDLQKKKNNVIIIFC